jgi:Holliday junction resolvase RusA-like endonuclease
LLRQELNAIRHEPYDFPIQVLLEFGCKTPKNPANDYPVGDIDNYAKAVLDSCNGAVFTDDKLIVDMWGSKYYSEDPHIHIEVHDGR